MTKTEAQLRDALLKCHAQLWLHQTKLNSPDVNEAVCLAHDALMAEVTPLPVFTANDKFVRGPSRPEGSGYKEMVFQLPSAGNAQMTADNLNSLFAAHCTQAKL